MLAWHSDSCASMLGQRSASACVPQVAHTLPLCTPCPISPLADAMIIQTNDSVWLVFRGTEWPTLDPVDILQDAKVGSPGV